MTKGEIYISTDIESDGPAAPGIYSMLSLGSVAFSKNGKVLGKFYGKLKRLKGAKQHPETMKWWKQNPKAYKEATSNAQSPSKIMNDYVRWLERLEKKHNKNLIFVSWPLDLDYPFVFWYMVKFVRKYQKIHPFEIPFSFGESIDTGTLIRAHLKKVTKLGDMPKKWFRGIGGASSQKNENRAHIAIKDALKEGKIFIRALKDNQKKKKK